MVRVPIGNHARCATEVRAVAPDANPYLALYGIFKTGIDGNICDDRQPARRRALSARQHLLGHRRLQGLKVDRRNSRRRRAGPLSPISSRLRRTAARGRWARLSRHPRCSTTTRSITSRSGTTSKAGCIDLQKRRSPWAAPLCVSAVVVSLTALITPHFANCHAS